MVKKCVLCGKKYGRQLDSCPNCIDSSPGIKLDKFWKISQINVVGNPDEIKGYGIDPEEEEKRMRRLVDEVIQRLPDEEPFSLMGSNPIPSATAPSHSSTLAGDP